MAGLILDPAVPANAAALDLAVLLLGVAAFFMIADAVQIAARGALQGLKDTTVPMLIAVATSWGLGIPTAVVLGFFLDFGGPGIWAGMAVAMTGAAGLLIRRFRRQSAQFAAEVRTSPAA